MTTAKRRSNCPISFALDIIGDKWSLLIVRDLAFTDRKTYSDFLKSEEGIATNILAQRLRSLLEAEIISKSPNEKDKRQDYYQLTQKGLDLLPILAELTLWSAKYDPDTIVNKDFLKQAEKIKAALLKKKK